MNCEHLSKIQFENSKETGENMNILCLDIIVYGAWFQKSTANSYEIWGRGLQIL